MTIKGKGTIPVYDADLIENAETCIDEPSGAQLRIWHGRAQHDLGKISSKELAVLERLAGSQASRARTIYNPYTGEIRKAFLPNWVGKHREEDQPIVGWTKDIT